MFAAYYGSCAAIKELARGKANLNTHSKSEHTVLDWAIVNGQYKTIQTIIQCGGVVFHLPVDEIEKKNLNLAAFVILQLLKNYIMNHPWQGICPYIGFLMFNPVFLAIKIIIIKMLESIFLIMRKVCRPYFFNVIFCLLFFYLLNFICRDPDPFGIKPPLWLMMHD